ncbi:hypothetical protein L596_013690 [Steinernema carpocapsae]|uniref:Uncharacterized protein n=1 Tax=Steinernema carpocapsae TaxID=34508 RepID=A0A4U5P0Y8_STECR|nr:hypothetical protein L596_013690 [Steinernema carpocapsae]
MQIYSPFRFRFVHASYAPRRCFSDLPCTDLPAQGCPLPVCLPSASSHNPCGHVVAAFESLQETNYGHCAKRRQCDRPFAPSVSRVRNFPNAYLIRTKRARRRFAADCAPANASL